VSGPYSSLDYFRPLKKKQLLIDWLSDGWTEDYSGATDSDSDTLSTGPYPLPFSRPPIVFVGLIVAVDLIVLNNNNNNNAQDDIYSATIYDAKP